MTVEAVDYEGTYDGAAHAGGVKNQQNLPIGTTITYSTDGGETWSSTVPSIKDFGTVNYKVKATNSNYEDATDDGTLEVTKRTVTLTSARNMVEQDG